MKNCSEHLATALVSATCAVATVSALVVTFAGAI
jgi:hypothetical protein